MVRSEGLESAMDMVENMSGEVLVISSQHDGGKQYMILEQNWK